MMKSILLTYITLCIFSTVFSQNSTGKYCPEQSELDENGTFKINRFKRKYQLELKINAIRVGRNGITQLVKINHSEKIKYESELINLNDSVAVQVQLAKSEHNGNKELHCKFKVFYLDGSCWKQNGIYNFEKLTSKEKNYNQLSSGGFNDVPFIELDKISIKIE